MQVIYRYIFTILFCLPLSVKASTALQQLNDTVQLEETVVVAVRPSESLTSATPFFKIDENRILRTGVTDISDAIYRLPGVTLRDYGGAGGLKTVSVRGLGAAHTAVSFDGIPMTEIQSGAIDFSRYSIDNLSSLELVIGDNNEIFLPVKTVAAPASLSIFTPQPDINQSTALTAIIKGGSFGFINPMARFSQRLSQETVLGITGEFLHTKNNYPFRLKNGNATTTEKREHNRINSGHGEINFKWQLETGTTLRTKIYYYDNDRQLPGPVIYYNVGKNREKLRERNLFAQAEFIQVFNKKWKLRAGGKFNWSGTFYTDLGSVQQGDFVSENYWQREYYATANLLFNPNNKWSFDYSADYSFNNLNSNRKNDAHPRRNALLQSLSAQYKISRFTFTGRLIESLYFEGAKSELVEKKRISKLSPAVSVSGRLLSTGLLFARLSYKNIFRMPSFNEAYFRHYGSPDLLPESTDQFDFGLTYQAPYYTILPLLSVTADVYINRVKDRIVAVPYNMFVWTITNLSSVHVFGSDVTLNSTVDLGKKQQLLLSGTWSYQRAKINVNPTDIIYGKQVAYIPLNSGSFSLSYENPWVNAILHGRGNSTRYTQNSNIPQSRLPGYFEFGFTLWRRFNIKAHELELRFDIMNMFDKQYSVIARYPMPGRSFMGTLKFTL